MRDSECHTQYIPILYAILKSTASNTNLIHARYARYAGHQRRCQLLAIQPAAEKSRSSTERDSNITWFSCIAAGKKTSPISCWLYYIHDIIYIHLHLTFKLNSYKYSSVCMRVCIISSLLQLHPSNPMKP